MVAPPWTTSRGVIVQDSDGSKVSMVSLRVTIPGLFEKQPSDDPRATRLSGCPAAAVLSASQTLSKLCE